MCGIARGGFKGPPFALLAPLVPERGVFVGRLNRFVHSRRPCGAPRACDHAPVAQRGLVTLVALVATGGLVLVAGAKPGAPPLVRSATPNDSSDRPALVELGDEKPTFAASVTTAIDASPARQPRRTPPAPTCPTDMVLIDGDECSEVDQPCLEWEAEAPGEAQRMRCLRFAPSRCIGTLTHVRFCIDRYEYPNVKGRLPVVMKTWVQATALCASRGRRLCKGGEWTLACEGEERLPYPYGYVRDESACNVDRPLSGPYPRMLEHQPRGVEVSLVDWRAPSGAMTQCTSPYGVHDMTGNVDEWVVNETGHPHASGLKGGYWGPVRDRCRPMTVAHDEQFAYYQIGLRCCEDAPRER